MKPVVLIAASLLALPLAAHAQGWNPSSDELVQMLKPRANGATRGIRPSNMAPAMPEPAAAPAPRASAPVRPAHVSAPAMAPAVAAASAPAAQTAQGAVNLTVQFESGSDRLAPAAMRTLDTLGKALANPELASYKFRIEGHTDSVGTAAANAALSERRAMAVAQYVSSHYGVDPARLTPVGMGQSQMLVPTAEGVAEPRNRRVQIVNISG